MTAQPTLWDAPPHPRVRATDPCTSLDAALSLTPGNAEAQILEVFAKEPHPWFMGGFTDDELAYRLPLLHPPTVKAARSRLSGSGALRDSGERRPSLRGRQMIVWGLA